MQTFIAALQERAPSIQHVSLLYDGIVVWGRHHPGFHSLYQYLRMHAFHVQVPSYVADTRVFDVSAAAPPAEEVEAALPALPAPAGPGMSGLQVGTGGGGRADAFQRATGIAAPALWAQLQGCACPWARPVTAHILTATLQQRWLRAVSGWRFDPVALRAAVARFETADSGSWPNWVGAAAASVAAQPAALASSPRSPALDVVIEPASTSPKAGPKARSSWYQAAAAATVATPGSAGTPGVDAAAFKRAQKPAMLAPPALPATARARNCLTSVMTVDNDASVLRLPYASAAYLESLPVVLEGLAGRRAREQSARHAPAPPTAAAAPRDTTASPVRPPSLPAPVVSMSAIGPEVLTATPQAAAAAETAASSDAAASRTVHVFCPPVFGYSASAPTPSHRLLWKQFGLITVLCYVDSAQMAGRPSLGQDRRLTAASSGPWPAVGSPGSSDVGAGSLPGTPQPASPAAAGPASTASPTTSAGGAPHTSRLAVDLNVSAVGALISAMHDVSTAYLPRIEAMVSDAVDAAATAAVAAGMDATKQVHWDNLECVADAYGLATVTRRPGKGRDAHDTPITRSPAVRAAVFAAEIPRHLWASTAQAQDCMPPSGANVATGLAGQWLSAAGGAGAGHWAPTTGAGADDVPARSGRQMLRHVTAARPRGFSTQAPTAAVRRQSLPADADAAGAAAGRRDRAQSGGGAAAEEGGAAKLVPNHAMLAATATAAAAPSSVYPYPASEEHWFSTRYEGAVAAARAGAREVFVMYDGRTPSSLPEAAARARQLVAPHLH
jgi:hypothetical protein